MYAFVLVMQSASLLVMLIIFAHLASKTPSRALMGAMMMIGGLAIMAIVYLMELSAASEEVAKAMVKLRFMTLSMTTVASLWFCHFFCRVHISKWTYLAESLLCIAVVFTSLAPERLGLVFTDFTMVNNGIYERGVYNPGIIYYLTYGNTCVVMLYAIIRCILRLRDSTGLERKRIAWVLLGLCITIIMTFLSIHGLTGGIDMVPFALFILALCFIIAFVRCGYFDSVHSATANFINFMQDSLIILSPKNEVLFVNPAAERLFPELRSGECLGEECVLSKYLEDCSDTLSINDRVFDVRIEPLMDGDYAQGSMLWLIDMTEHYIHAEQVRALSQRAEVANNAKSDFLTSMSHEVRTPMNAVLGMSRMIMRESSEKKVVGYAQNIEKAGNSLLGIINDILDISKIEKGELVISPAEYRLSSLLTDLYNLTMWRAQDKQLELLMDVPEDMPDYLMGDELRIRQAMTNIVGNAIKYTETGSIKIGLSWNWTGEPNVMRMGFSVTDTGVGISEENQKKLFQSFVRLDDVKNRAVEGTGLGLAITSKLVSLMDGDIGCDSKLGEGSTFYFNIPQKVLDSEPIGKFGQRILAADEPEDKPAFYAPDTDALIVDDNEMNLTVASELLRRTGMHVTTAMSGAECIALMERNRYDILLLDHMMPELDGVETLKRLRQMNLLRGTPVIALTANAVVGAKEMYLDLGFDDYVPKSVEPQYMENVIAKHLKPKKAAAKAIDRSEMSILAIDNDPEMLGALRSALKDRCRLTPVRTVEQAQGFFLKHKPEVILCAPEYFEQLSSILRENAEMSKITLLKLQKPFSSEEFFARLDGEQ